MRIFAPIAALLFAAHSTYAAELRDFTVAPHIANELSALALEVARDPAKKERAACLIGPVENGSAKADQLFIPRYESSQSYIRLNFYRMPFGDKFCPHESVAFWHTHVGSSDCKLSYADVRAALSFKYPDILVVQTEYARCWWSLAQVRFEIEKMQRWGMPFSLGESLAAPPGQYLWLKLQ